MLQYCCCCYFVYLFLFCFLTPLLSLCIGHTAYVCVCVFCLRNSLLPLANLLAAAPFLTRRCCVFCLRQVMCVQLYIYICVCVSEWFVPHVAPSSPMPLLFLLLQLVLCCHCCLPLPLVSFARCTLCFALYSLVSLVPTFGIIVFASQWCWQRLC